MGESTVAMAATRPEINLLAVEVYKPGVAQTLHHLQPGRRAQRPGDARRRGPGADRTDRTRHPRRGVAVLPRSLAEDQAPQAPAGHPRVRGAGRLPVAPRRQSSGWPPTGRPTRSGCSPPAPRPRACATRTPAGRRDRSSGRAPGSSGAVSPPGTRSSIWSSPAADRRRRATRCRPPGRSGLSPGSTIAATGPPPSGPWWAADTDTNTAGSPVTDAATPPTQALICRCQCTSESSSMALRRPRTSPSCETSHLRKTLTSRPSRSAVRGRSGRSRPAVFDRLPDAVGVQRVLHHRVTDAVPAADPAGVADHDHLRLVQLDPRRAGGDRRIQRPVVHDVGIGRHLDLAERHRHAEGGAPVRQVHRLVGVLGPHRLAAWTWRPGWC